MVLTMNVTLSLISLHHEQVGYMPGNMVLVTGGVSTKHFLKTVMGESTKLAGYSSQRS